MTSNKRTPVVPVLLVLLMGAWAVVPEGQVPISVPYHTVPILGYPGMSHLVFGGPGDNPLVPDEMLSRHGPNSNDRGMFFSVMGYDKAHERLNLRTENITQLNNPANLRLTRVELDSSGKPIYAPHRPGEILGIIGASDMRFDGIGPYGSSIHFIAAGEGKGAICLGTMGGIAGIDPDGNSFKADEVVSHVCVYEDGHVVIGVNTDPRLRPQVSLEVEGNTVINGDFVVNGNFQANSLTVNGTVAARNFALIK